MISAVIPAFNEEQTIGAVVRTVRAVPDIDVVIVVNDGSNDRTSAVARAAGATVIDLPHNIGKGGAMRVGALSTKADAIFFADADLIGLRPHHVQSVIDPVMHGHVAMCIGIRERWGNLAEFFSKLDPLLAIGGERAIRRDIFDALPGEYFKAFEIETAMNHYCREHKYPVSYVKLEGLAQVVKEEKYGFIDGFFRRVVMIGQIVKRRVR
ncbi:MAG: glycosyltransferase family 2 protein, partial [Candidatus Yonathbacteria bacterium]|nr:glycosyltransferase family 2 protein [Candidatus Yonathbacteria bacterium]